MITQDNNPLWVEKYRPNRIQDCILPADIKQTFQDMVDQKVVPNITLAGTAGVGKTTVAKALLKELGCDYIVINGSMNGNIDTLRNEIQNFASSVSLSGGRKYVILDEADFLNANSTQPALRNFMEEFSKNCGFILTCNFKAKILPALLSRAPIIEFRVNKEDAGDIAAQFMKRVMYILDAEGVTYDVKVVAEIIKKFFPDFRATINALQRYSTSGKIDAGILSTSSTGESSFSAGITLTKLLEYIKEKNFSAVRKWIGENLDSDHNTIFGKLYDTLSQQCTSNSVPALVLILAKYQYQSAFVVDQEINMAACLTEIMIEADWK